MKKTAFTEEQITYALRQAETGTPVADICRKLGVSEQTFYRWKKRFQGLEVPQAKRLKQLEDENGRLKRLLADQMLANEVLREALEKRGLL